MVVTDTSGGAPVSYHVPLTYRGAPLDGAGEEALVGTAEHGVLGRRWVYDGVHDPLLVGQVRELLRGRSVPQAQSLTDTPDPTVEPWLDETLAREGGEPALDFVRVLREGPPRAPAASWPDGATRRGASSSGSATTGRRHCPSPRRPALPRDRRTDGGRPQAAPRQARGAASAGTSDRGASRRARPPPGMPLPRHPPGLHRVTCLPGRPPVGRPHRPRAAMRALAAQGQGHTNEIRVRSVLHLRDSTGAEPQGGSRTPQAGALHVLQYVVHRLRGLRRDSAIWRTHA